MMCLCPDGDGIEKPKVQEECDMSAVSCSIEHPHYLSTQPRVRRSMSFTWAITNHVEEYVVNCNHSRFSFVRYLSPDTDTSVKPEGNRKHLKKAATNNSDLKKYSHYFRLTSTVSFE